MAKTNIKNKIKEYTNAILRNAFDFLKTSAEQFEQMPKYSIINFSSAIELFLKARLLKEHWSLIVQGEPNIQNFQQGSFSSIAFKDLIPKINNILGNEINKDTEKYFKELAEDRNYAIHFYHKQIGSGEQQEFIELAAKQLKAWEYLKNLLQKWEPLFKENFDSFNNEIIECDELIKKHSKYLAIKYESVKDDIATKISKGARYCKCDRCNFEAVNLNNKISQNVYSGICEVCNYDQTHGLILECPECNENKNIIISEYDIQHPHIITCDKCKMDLQPEYILETFLNSSEKQEINCNNCDTENCVVLQQCVSPNEENSIYICTKCLNISYDLEHCNYCNQFQIGDTDLSNSYFWGCNWCEGAIQRDLMTGEHGLM